MVSLINFSKTWHIYVCINFIHQGYYYPIFILMSLVIIPLISYYPLFL